MLTLLCIVTAMFSAAFICGRGQQISPQSPSDPEVVTQEVEISEEPLEGEVTPQQEPPEEEVPPDVGQADLIIQNASVSVSQRPGEVDVSVVAIKQGTAQVTSSFTIIWKPHAKSDEIGCSWDINANKINQGPVTKSCQYTYPGFGEMHWSAIVDATNDVGEAEENNNVITGIVAIQKVQIAPTIAPPTNCSWRVASIPRIIELAWQYTMPADIDGFRIYMAGTSLELVVGKNANQASIPNLELNTQYHFDVRAYKGNVESAADMCSVDATTGQ